jgi:site-specific recombinase XerD
MTPPLSTAIQEYLAWLEIDRHKSRRTVTEYADDLRRFSDFAGGDEAIASVDKLNRELLRAYQRHLGELRPLNRSGEPIRGRKRLAPATRKRRLVCLKSFLKFVGREEWTTGDLGAHIDLPSQPERLPKPIQEKTRTRLGEALPTGTPRELRDRALILFLLSTGCRISEALQLNRTDWQREQVVVMGKRSKERVVIVSAKARTAMDAYLASRDDPSPALFVGFQRAQAGEAENRLTPGGARYLCDQVARRLGLERWHPHQLRHTFGTAIEEELGDPRLTAELLGHSGLGSVSGYTKISRRRREEAAEALADRGF